MTYVQELEGALRIANAEVERLRAENYDLIAGALRDSTENERLRVAVKMYAERYGTEVFND